MLNTLQRRLGRRVGLLLAFASATTAVGITAPQVNKPMPGMLDARVNAQGTYHRAMAARLERGERGLAQARQHTEAIANAVKVLQRQLPAVEMKFSNLTGAPTSVYNKRGSLTEPSPALSSEIIVRNFLMTHGDIYGLSQSDLNDLVVLGDSPGAQEGVRMLRMEQQVNGRPIFQSETRFILKQDGSLVKSLGTMVPRARSVAPPIQPGLLLTAPEAATALLVNAGQPADPNDFTVLSNQSGKIELTENHPFVKGEITAKEVWFPLSPGVLVPAWSVTMFTSGDQDWYAIVDQETGDILWRKNIRSHASIHNARFRVYTQADGKTPADSPAPASPTPATPGSNYQAPAISPAIVSMHSVMNSTASPNGWIDDCPNGVCGTQQIITRGNNVDVCLDRIGGSNEDICDTAASSILDFNGRPKGNPDANGRERDFLGITPRDFQGGFNPPPYMGSPTLGQTATGNGNNGTTPVDSFRRGVVTQLFYTSNWYHDVLYALGFDEASGNFQTNNFGKGGAGNDRVLADAQDGSGTNNANFSTPADGASGRVQMYIWEPAEAATLTVGAQAFNGGVAGFGPTSFTIPASGTAQIVLGQDNIGTSTDACEPLVGTYTGKIVLVDRGSCSFESKAKNIQTKGGVGALIANNAAGFPPNPMADDTAVTGVTIGTIGLTQADGTTLKQQISAGAIQGKMVRQASALPVRDGGLDNEIVIHELTHGTSNRLVGNGAGLNWAPGKGLGEGWSDIYALSLLNPTDDWSQKYVKGAYATYGGPAGFTDNYSYGIRRFPYSINKNINPLTWADVDDVTYNSSGGIPPSPNDPTSFIGAFEEHQVGEIWTNTLWGARALFMAYFGNSTGNQEFLQVLTNALKMTPVDPSFTDARDALIEADCAISYACKHEELIWSAFASRGLGYGAETPYNIVGHSDFAFMQGHMAVKESFKTPHLDVANPFTDVMVDDSAGNNTQAIDSGEQNIKLKVKLTNPWHSSTKSGTGITATLSTSTPGVTITGSSASYSAILPQNSKFGSDFTINVGAGVPCGSAIDFTITTTSTLGNNIAVPFRVRLGVRNGMDIPVTYTATPMAPGLTIPPNSPRGVTHTQTIAADYEIADLDFRIDNVQHPAVGGLTFELRSPDGIGTDFISGIGDFSSTHYYTNGTKNWGGANIVNMRIDDDLPAAASNDMVQAPNTAAPYTGSWLPVFNSPWIESSIYEIVCQAFLNPDCEMFRDSTGNLSRFDGRSTKGTWTILAADQSSPSMPGLLKSWSMIVTPTRFTCASLGAVVKATKTVAGTYKVGNNVTYTVTLTNSSGANQGNNTGNEFTDVLPAGLTLVSASVPAGNGTALATPATNTVTWNGSIAPGGSVPITINATIKPGTQGTLISSQGTVSFDSDGNNTNDATIPTDDPATPDPNDATRFIVQNSAVAATKTVNGSSFKVDDVVFYTIALTNTGNTAAPDNAGSDELTDVLPTQLALLNVSASSGTPVADFMNNTVKWNGSIPVNGTVTVTIAAKIKPNPQQTTVSNQASVLYDADLNGSNETTLLSDDPTVNGAQNPTVFNISYSAASATQTVAGAPYQPGGTVTYTVTLTNNGTTPQNNNATDEFINTLPPELTLVSAMATNGTATPDVPNNSVKWNGSLAAVGGTVTITITATIKSNVAPGTTISNQGNMYYDSDNNGTNDITIPTNVANFTVPVSKVSATKTVSGIFRVGNTVTYSIVLKNEGTTNQIDDTQSNEFTDVLPSGLSLVNATASAGTPFADPATNTVTWNGGLAAGSNVNLTITASINAGTHGTVISNQGNVSYDSDSDGVNDTNAATDEPTLPGAADPTVFTVESVAISVTKTVSGTFNIGDVVTYTLKMANQGTTASPDNAGDELTDVLPPELELLSAAASSGSVTTTLASNTVTWNGTVPTDKNLVTLLIVARIKANPQQMNVDNQATFNFDADLDGTNDSNGVSDDPDTVNVNDPTTFTIQTAPTSVLSATKTVTVGNYDVNDTVTYTIVLSNSGNTASLDNAGDELTDTLPAELTLLNATVLPPGSGTATVDSPTNKVMWNGSVPAGGNTVITITANIKPGMQEKVVSNQATIAIDANLDGTNESSTTSDDPSLPGANDPTVFTVSDRIFWNGFEE